MVAVAPAKVELRAYDNADETCRDDADGRWVVDLPLVDGRAGAHLPAGIYEVSAEGEDWQGCIGVDVPALSTGARCAAVSMEIDDPPAVDVDYDDVDR